MVNCDKKYPHHCYYIAIAQLHQKARKITAYKELEIILPNFNRLKLTNIIVNTTIIHFSRSRSTKQVHVLTKIDGTMVLPLYHVDFFLYLDNRGI